jgi:hypothetical protein
MFSFIVVVWLFFCLLVGMAAHNHRQRGGPEWFAIAVLISPLLAFPLLYALPVREEVYLKHRNEGLLVTVFAIVVFGVVFGISMMLSAPARAQLGPSVLNGRPVTVTPESIVPAHAPWILPPPLPYAPEAPLPPPGPVAVAPEPLPAPPPLGWVYGPYLNCLPPAPNAPPTCLVQVSADGLNVRAAPQGPPTMALVNGTPLVLLDRASDWWLVSSACSLTPTFLWSWTANVPLMRCWVW